MEVDEESSDDDSSDEDEKPAAKPAPAKATPAKAAPAKEESSSDDDSSDEDDEPAKPTAKAAPAKAAAKKEESSSSDDSSDDDEEIPPAKPAAKAAPAKAAPAKEESSSDDSDSDEEEDAKPAAKHESSSDSDSSDDEEEAKPAAKAAPVKAAKKDESSSEDSSSEEEEEPAKPAKKAAAPAEDDGMVIKSNKGKTVDDFKTPTKTNQSYDNPKDKSEEGRKIFIHNVGEEMQYETFQELVEQHGTVEDFFNPGRGFAFLTFSTAEEAHACIKAMDNTEVGGNVVQMNIARPKGEKPRDVHLFVHGVSQETTTGDLQEVFEEFGTVTDAFNPGRGFAFITF